MAQKRRDSDLSSELYFSVYGSNRKLKQQKLKTYALYKPLLENTTANNFVVATNETNEILVSFKEGSESKIFTLDKVFYCDIPQDDFHLLCKSAIQDLIVGINSFFIFEKLASPTSPGSNSSFKMDLSLNIVVNVLKELLTFVNKEENKECSLHVSYFEIHGNCIVDNLSECDESRDIQIYENSEKDCVEIKGLTEKPVTDNKDIDDFFTNRTYNSKCNETCCHTVIFVSLIKKNINSDRLEFIKVGKLTLVGPAECKILSPSTDDCLLHFAENETLTSWKSSNMLSILKPAFGEKVVTTVIVLLSSVLFALEKDLRMLQFLSEVKNFITCPEINLQLVIRDSTKEYAEEIKELQRDLDSTSKHKGVSIGHLLYRSFKNTLALENEKVQNLSGQVMTLKDSISFKKQQIISLQAALESKKTEIKEVQKSSKELRSELEEMENENNITQKVSSKADEIIDIKQMIISNELYIKKLKTQIREDSRNHEELIRSIYVLKNETASLLYDIDAQNNSQKSAVELLIVDMNNSFSEFQNLEKDLTIKLNSLLNIDVVIKTWKNCMENLIRKFSSFIFEKHEHFTSMETENTVLASYHTSRDPTVDIKNTLHGKGSTLLKYYFSKLQVFCDSSFKLLADIIHQMDVIDNCYKAEFKALSTAFCSINEAFKKFISEVNVSLKSFQEYFEEQEKQLIKMADIICFHQNFQKQFGDMTDSIKRSLSDLKQIYLNYNEASSSNWNEIQKGGQRNMQKHNELSDYFSLFQKESSKYLNNLPQKKMNIFECSPLKDKVDNVENQILQLLQMHKEMKGNFDEALTVHKKAVDEECFKVEKYVSVRKSEIGKYFDAFSAKLEALTRSFVDELRSMHKNSSENKENLKEDLDSLLSSVSNFDPVFNKYVSTSSSILAKSELSFKAMPSVSEDKKDSISDFENLFLEEWNVTTSTPNVTVKKEFNIMKEKEKLICRIKSIAEQQLPQKSNTSVLDCKEEKSKNTSTVSLPVLRTHSNASLMTEKSFPRSKFQKK